jgi:hypothetical protein
MFRIKCVFKLTTHNHIRSRVHFQVLYDDSIGEGGGESGGESGMISIYRN